MFNPARLTIALVLLCVAVSRADVIERPIQLPKNQNEDGVVLLPFYTGGRCDSKGKGLAVVTKDGQPVAFKIVTHNPTAQTWLALDLTNVNGPLRLRYDTKPLKASKPTAEVTPSLLLHVYPFKNNAVKNADQLVAAVKSSKPLGTMPVSRIDLQHNPLGQPTQFIMLFEGLLQARTSVKLRMFSSHDDAAFVSIGDNRIINGARPLLTRSSAQIAKSAVNVELKKGAHRVEYLHAQTSGQTRAMLGYINSNKRAAPLPANFFVHHPIAKLGDAASADAIGFDAEPIDQLAYENLIYSRWRLRPIAPLAKGDRYRWDFGDGSTTMQTADAKQRAVEHVFLGKPNDLSAWHVKLERIKDNAKTIAQATSTVRPIPGINVRSVNDDKVRRGYVQAINRCKHARSPAPLLIGLYNLLWHDERPQDAAALADEFVKRFGKRQDAASWQIKYMLAGHIVREDPKRAARLFRELSRTTKDSWKAACAAAWHLDVLVFNLGKGAELSALATRLAAGKAPRERSLLMARLGDVHRLAGDEQKAREAYQRAQRTTFLEMGARKAAVLERAHREAALDYMHQKRYPAMRDALFQWEADFPTAKLGGDLPLLTGRYFQAMGDDRRAVIEFESLLKLNPLHPSRPEIAFRLGQSLQRLGKVDQADQWLHEVRTKYPNSPFASGDAK